MRTSRQGFWESIPEDVFRHTVAEARSIADVLRALGNNQSAGHYLYIRRRIEGLELSTGHFMPYHSGNGSGGRKRPLSEILVEHSDYNNGQSLRRRMVAEGLLEDKCYECGLPPTWSGKPLTLRLDHKNGVHDDNRSDNIRLLCPNCDSQSEFYGGRNIGRTRYSTAIMERAKKETSRRIEAARPPGWKPKVRRSPRTCSSCGLPIGHQGLTGKCGACIGRSRQRIEWPAASGLLIEVREEGMLAVAKRLGVSDTAIKKHLRQRGLPDNSMSIRRMPLIQLEEILAGLDIHPA